MRPATDYDRSEEPQPGVTLDDVLRKVGEFGVYQKRIFYLLCLPSLTHGIRMLISFFMLNMPDHRCALPDYENDTYSLQSAQHQALVNASVPLLFQAGSWRWDPCRLYRHPLPPNSSDVTHGNHSTVPCRKWVYDTSIFTSTAASEFDLVCEDALRASHAQMIFMGGFLTGSFLTGLLSDRLGRKKTLFLSMLLMTGGGLALAWAPNFSAFLALRFLNGNATAGIFMTIFVISVEIVGPSKRGFVGIMIEVWFALGVVTVAGLGFLIRDWRRLEIACAAPVAAFLLFWWLIPESPRWLLAEGRREEAERELRRMVRVNKAEVPEEVLRGNIVVASRSESGGSVLQLCSSCVLLVRTLIICFNWLVISMVYYGLSLNSGNLGSGDLFLNFFLVGAVEFPAYLLCFLLLERWGRKLLHCGSMLLGGGACVLCIFTILYAGTETQWVTVTLAMVGKLGLSAAFCIIFIFTSELFPTVVRQAGMGVSSSMARVGGMLAPYIVDGGRMIGGDFGRAFPLMVFGGLSVAAGLMSLLLPETLHRNLPDTLEEARRFGRTDVLVAEMKAWSAQAASDRDKEREAPPS